MCCTGHGRYWYSRICNCCIKCLHSRRRVSVRRQSRHAELAPQHSSSCLQKNDVTISNPAVVLSAVCCATDTATALTCCKTSMNHSEPFGAHGSIQDPLLLSILLLACRHLTQQLHMLLYQCPLAAVQQMLPLLLNAAKAAEPNSCEIHKFVTLVCSSPSAQAPPGASAAAAAAAAGGELGVGVDDSGDSNVADVKSLHQHVDVLTGVPFLLLLESITDLDYGKQADVVLAPFEDAILLHASHTHDMTCHAIGTLHFFKCGVEPDQG